MSSINYGHEGIPSNDETMNSSSAIIQNPYLNPNANAAYAAAAAAAVGSSSTAIGPYQHYYDHSLPPQQLLHVQQTAGFYPTPGILNHHQHHIDFNNSSPSVASSSSSIESSRKITCRKRHTASLEKLPGMVLPTKANTKRKPVSLFFV